MVENALMNAEAELSEKLTLRLREDLKRRQTEAEVAGEAARVADGLLDAIPFRDARKRR